MSADPTPVTAIDAAVARAFDAAVDAATDLPAAAPFVAIARAATEGGKRFRGSGAVLGTELMDEAGAAALPLAAALELYQASALVHDDVIDRAETRRGRAAPHVDFAALHATEAWSGDSAHFGTSAAVLVGDLLMSAADLALSGAPMPVRRRFAQMTAEVAIGQYLDVQAEQVPLSADVDELPMDVILSVVRLKSARYSVVHPVVIGALAAGADDALVLEFESVLEPWGAAFQLRDDELGAFGDPALTGKPVGDDLREGKRTALLALTWRAATRDERATLARDIGRADLTDGEIAALQDIVERRGRGEHEALISRLVAEGDRALASSSMDAGQQERMRAFARVLTERSS